VRQIPERKRESSLIGWEEADGASIIMVSQAAGMVRWMKTLHESSIDPRQRNCENYNVNGTQSLTK
jgi:hypothetical protein